MRILFFSTLCCCLFFCGNVAAQESIPLKPDRGELAVTLEASGFKKVLEEPVKDVFNNQRILVKYNKDTYFVYRCGLGLNGGSTTTGSRVEPNDSTFTFREDVEKQFGFSISPGLEYHFSGTRRLDPYFGVELPIGKKGKKTTDNLVETQNGTQFSSTKTDKLTEPGEFSFGLNALAGFNYFLAERVAIGAEYSLGFAFTNQGGTTKKESSNTVTNGSNTDTTMSESQSEIINKNSKLFNDGVVAFTITYYFGEK